MTAPRILVLSTSLHPQSRSRVMAIAARAELDALGAQTSWFDCRDVQFPYMDGHSAGSHAATVALRTALGAADAVFLASGIYNFDVSAVAKACLELGGKAWDGKVVCIGCATGSMVSFMAPMGLANSLMLDFRCVVVPRFPMATQAEIVDGAVADAETSRRIREACAMTVRLADATRGA
jgi:NAD(P)H-dependent FMN reductase